MQEQIHVQVRMRTHLQRASTRTCSTQSRTHTHLQHSRFDGGEGVPQRHDALVVGRREQTLAVVAVRHRADLRVADHLCVWLVNVDGVAQHRAVLEDLATHNRKFVFIN